ILNAYRIVNKANPTADVVSRRSIPSITTATEHFAHQESGDYGGRNGRTGVLAHYILYVVDHGADVVFPNVIGGRLYPIGSTSGSLRCRASPRFALFSQGFSHVF